MDKYEVIVFNDNNLSLEVNIDKDKDTVWLTQKRIAELFGVSIDSISLHIKNILNENELDY